MKMAATARITRNDATLIAYDTDPRVRAIESFNETHRRQRMHGMMETAADAALATGGLFLANASMHLGMGLPDGRNGIALGGAMLAGGMIWVTRKLSKRNDQRDPAGSARRPILVAIDGERSVA